MNLCIFTDFRPLRQLICLPLGWLLLSTIAVAGPPPLITVQPVNQTAQIGGSAPFYVEASSGTTMTFQWYFQGVAIPGATNALYNRADAQLTNAGNYNATVINSGGTTTSSNASLTVVNYPVIASDNTSSAVTNAATISWPHTVGAGNNRILMVGVVINNSTRTLSSATYGGQNLTLIGQKTSGTSSKVRVVLYQLLSPPVGTSNVVVTISAADHMSAGAVSFTGVSQTSPLGTFVSAGGSGASGSVNVTSATGEVVFDIFGATGDALTLTSGAGQLPRWNTSEGSTSNNVVGGSSTENGVATTAMSWTLGATKPWAQGAVALKPAGLVVSGNVFEDVNYGGGAGCTKAAAGGVGRPSARVELYNQSGNLVTNTLTDAGGNYSFNVTTITNYSIRVVNSSVTSSRGGAALIPVQTFRTTATNGTVTTVVDRVGGEDPAKGDAGNGSTTLAALTTSTTTAQSVAAVSFGNNDIPGLDFGFNFDTIVNTNNAGQGSLRQFILNANALAGPDASIFMITDGNVHPGLRAGLANQLTGAVGSQVARFVPTTDLPPITNASTTLDGAAQTANVGNLNTVVLGTGGTVGVDGIPLGQVAGPEVEIKDSGSLTNGLAIQASNVTIRGLSIYGFGAVDGQGAIVIADTFSGTLIENNVLGTTATSFSDPGATLHSWHGVYSGGADNGTIRSNLFGFIGRIGVFLANASTNWTISGNEIRNSGTETADGDGITISTSAANTITGNLIAGSSSQGITVTGAGSTGNSFVNNTLTGNGVGTTSIISQSQGICIRSSTGASLFDRNVVSANYGAGLAVNNGATSIRLTRNSFFNNGTITNRSGGGATGQIGIDLNSATDDINLGTAPFVTTNAVGARVGGNNLRNFPVLSHILLSGTNTVILGTLNSTANTTFTLEFFSNPNASSSGYGEGQTFLNSITVITDGSGNAAFTNTLSGAVAPNHWVSATATDPAGNTSEFSALKQLNSAPVANAQGVSTPEDTAKPITLTGSDVDTDPLTFTIVAGPTNGVVSGLNTNNGTLTYTPNTNFNGADSFTFQVNDGVTNSTLATVSITVTPVNDAPIAFSQSVTNAEDTATAITLTGSDVDGPVTNFTVVASPTHGTLSGTAPNLTYAPATNYNGADSFTFKVNDGSLTSAVATVTITLTAVNDAPIALSQSVTNAEDTAKAITLTSSDVDGPVTNFTLVTAPTQGTLSGTAPNLTYLPATNYNGFDSFTFNVNDGSLTSAVATVSITVTPVNDAPTLTGANNLPAISEDPTNNLGMMVSDLILGAVTDADSGSVAGISMTAVDNSNGTWQYSTNGGSLWLGLGVPSAWAARLLAADALTSVRFVPNTNWFGTVVNGLTFRAWDQTSGAPGGTADISDTGTLLDQFSAVTYTNNHGTTAWSSPWVETDSGGGGASGGFILISGGQLQLKANLAGDSIYREANLAGVTNATLTFDYVNSIPSGSDQFDVQISGNGGSTWTTLGSFSRFLNTGSGSKTFDISAYSASNTRIRFLEATQSSNKSIYVDNIQISYLASKVGGPTAFSTNIAAASITVTPVNDAPISLSQSVTNAEDTAKAITLTSSDVDGPVTNFTLVSSPTNGALSGTAPNLTYTPPTNFNGADSFTFTVNDGSLTSALATVSITVTAVNDVPVAFSQSVTNAEDTATAITLTSSDVDGPVTNFTVVAAPTNGNLSGTVPNLTYTPNTNYNGADSFTFTVNDGSLTSAVATVSITVTPVNDVPIAFSQSVTNAEDSTLPITLASSDVDGPATNFTVVAAPTNGNLSGTAPNLTYTPNTNFNGADSFTFSINDGSLTSAVATVSITVTPVNDAPIAFSQNVTNAEDSTLPITLASSDVDGPVTNFTVVAAPTNGNLSGTAPDLTYTPNTNFNGADSFTFSINDGSLTSAVATVSITVTSVNDAPLAFSQSVTNAEDTALPITLAASDVENDPLTFSIVSGPTNGVLSGLDVTNGTATYTPNTNFNGPDSFTFRVSDAMTNSGLATVTILVTPVNDVPTPSDDVYTLGKNSALTLANPGVLDNDTDADGNPLNAAKLADPAHGTLTLNANGGFTYTPASNYFGADSFTYQADDGFTNSPVATVTLNITNLNRTPVANDQSVTTPEATPWAVTLTASDMDSDPLTYAIVASPAHGALSGFNTNTGALTYTPATGYTGPDSFTFRANDGLADSPMATVNLTVTSVADVGATVTGPVSTFANASFSYTIAVTNAGPSAATNLSVTDVLPAGVTFVAGSSTAGATVSGNQVIWTNLGSLPAGAMTNLTLTVIAPASGLLTNNVSATASPSDPNLANNDGTAITATAVTAIYDSPTITGQPLPGGTFQINFTTGPDMIIQIQASTNLVNWVTLVTTNSGSGAVSFIDLDAVNHRLRFYRAAQ